MLAQLRPFARRLVVVIAAYAKGRKLEAADFKTVEAITEASAKTDYRLNDMVCLIAESPLMTNR